MNEDLIFRLVVSVVLIILSPYMILLIKRYLDKVKDEKLRNLVLTFVEAADQMLKSVDPTGEQRKDYVLRSLQEVGVECDTYVNALIEQAVLGLWYYEPNKKEEEE